MLQSAHYAILTAMLAPAFFLTATASLLMSANNRLARVVDRLRVLLHELDAGGMDDAQIQRIDRRIAIQRTRANLVLRGSQMLYGAISLFVCTSLAVAIDGFLGYRMGYVPTVLAMLGVVTMFAASLSLARESALAVSALNEEMDHAHSQALLGRGGG